MHKISLIATLMLASAPMVASAADGTITFTGNVTDKTCTISTAGGADFSVALPTVSNGSLAAAGAVSGRTPFAINLTQCSAGNVATFFEPGATVDFNSGRLINQQSADAATNVQLQLLGANSQFLPIRSTGAGLAQENSQWVNVAAANGAANLNYYVEYYATGAATAGTVSSSVRYTIIYN